MPTYTGNECFGAYIAIIYLFMVQNPQRGRFKASPPFPTKGGKNPWFPNKPIAMKWFDFSYRANRKHEKKSQFWSTQAEANWYIHPQGRLFGHWLLGSPDSVCRTAYLPAYLFSSWKRHCSKSLKTQLPLSRLSLALKSSRIPGCPRQ